MHRECWTKVHMGGLELPPDKSGGNFTVMLAGFSQNQEIV